MRRAFRPFGSSRSMERRCLGSSRSPARTRVGLRDARRRRRPRTAPVWAASCDCRGRIMSVPRKYPLELLDWKPQRVAIHPAPSGDVSLQAPGSIQRVLARRTTLRRSSTPGLTVLEGAPCVQVASNISLPRWRSVRQAGHPAAGNGMVEPRCSPWANPARAMGFNGKEGVNGSSPLEGFVRSRMVGPFAAPPRPPMGCRSWYTTRSSWRWRGVGARGGRGLGRRCQVGELFELDHGRVPLAVTRRVAVSARPAPRGTGCDGARVTRREAAPT